MAAGDGIQVLPQGAGYGIVIGIGGIFALVMLGITWLQNRYVSYQNLRIATKIDQHDRHDSLLSKQRSLTQLRDL